MLLQRLREVVLEANLELSVEASSCTPLATLPVSLAIRASSSSSPPASTTAGENGNTGATKAFPSFRAIPSATLRAINVWPPSTACGPLCSVPPLKNEHRGFSLLVYGRVDFWVRHEFKLDWSWFLRQTQGTQDYQRKDTVHRLFPR